MKIKKLISILSIPIIVFTLASCNTYSKEPACKEVYKMGTIIELKVYGKNKEKALEKALNRLDEIENKMSVNINSSDISKINTSAGKAMIKVHTDTYSVITQAVKYASLTEGAFDPTVEPLVSLWGIGTNHARVPSPKEIKDKVNLINYKDILFDKKNSSIGLKRENQALDLGGIAKGYAADEIKKVLINENIKSAFLNIGGNVYAIGNKIDNTPWKIGLQNPLKPRGTYLGVIPISDESIVTSGNYERYFTENGKRYHHIFDVTTGYPAEKGLISTTIISKKSIDCDALSTSVYVLGLEKGKALIENLNGVDAIFITNDKKIYVTSGFKDKFKLLDKSFQLIK